MPDRKRTPSHLLDDIRDFIEKERHWYGDWQIQNQRQAPDSDALAQPASNHPAQAAAGHRTTRSRSGDKTEPEPKPSSPLTLQNCTTLDQLRTLCDTAEELKTDLENTNLVFGVGNPEADLMLVGEAPGFNEDQQGEPFVGRAGKLLNQILEAIKFSREDVYIANILKHRPPDNRNPTPEERQKSLPFLMKQIDIIQPKLILCLGRVSATTLLEKDDSLKNMRGSFHPFRGAQLMVTYHPAALLRNPNWKRPTWEDVQRLRERYDELGCRP